MVLLPFIVIVYGPPAAGVFTASCHFAFSVTTVESVLPLQLLVIYTFSSGLPHPHSFTEDFCCSTILLLITAGSVMLALTRMVTHRNKKVKIPFINSYCIVIKAEFNNSTV